MKEFRLFVITVFVFSVSGIHAQGLHLGLKAGANVAQLSGRAFNDGFQWGFSAGAFAEVNLTSKWGVQPELLFSQNQTQTANGFEEIIPQGYNNLKVTLNYLSIPILLSYKPIPVLSLQIGPQFGILMNPGVTVANSTANAFKSGDFAMVGGAQVNLGPVKAGVRYVYGLTNLNNVNNADSWKTQNFQIYMGLRIF